MVDPEGILRDLTIDGNSSDPERNYAALNAQATWRFGTRLNVNGSYTLSRTYGTFDGETLNNGPITAGPISAGSSTNGRAGWGTYPEYVQAAWNRPEGDLSTDQRHRARIWAVYQVPLSERWGRLSLSGIEQMNSGSPYFAAGPLNPTTYVSVPSYQTPPTQVAYFFTDRDAFRTDNVFRTDLALNYSYKLRGSARALLPDAGLERLQRRRDRGRRTTSTSPPGPATAARRRCRASTRSPRRRCRARTGNRDPRSAPRATRTRTSCRARSASRSASGSDAGRVLTLKCWVPEC